MLQSQRTAQYVTWICIAIIIILSLLPGGERPHTGLSGKLEHIIAYAGTGVFAAIGYQLARQRLAFWLAMVILSFMLELLQQYVPGRGPSIYDALSSSSGLTIGLLIGAYSCLKIFNEDKPYIH
jgi:hypothetical protein